MGRFRSCNLTHLSALSTDSCLRPSVNHMEISYDCCSENLNKQGIGYALQKELYTKFKGISTDEHLSRTVPSADV